MLQFGPQRLQHIRVTGIAGDGTSSGAAEIVATRIRQLGVERVVYGSDAAVGEATPANQWSNFSRLPLSQSELAAIATNLAPYWSLPQAQD